MPSTTRYSQGDVVLVPFPFTDLSTAKQRPALVVSSDALNSAREDVIVVAITSQVPTKLADDELSIPSADLNACGLPKASIVRLSKIASRDMGCEVRSLDC